MLRWLGYLRPWPLTLNFQGQIVSQEWDFKINSGICYLSQPKMVRLPWNKKQTYQFNVRPQMGSSGLTLAITLTLNFQGQIWNLLYLSRKWSDCHEVKSKHISWNLGLKWDHQVWPWTWILKVNYGIYYISAKNGLIATKRKANISIELQASNVTMTLKGELCRSNQ